MNQSYHQVKYQEILSGIERMSTNAWAEGDYELVDQCTTALYSELWPRVLSCALYRDSDFTIVPWPADSAGQLLYIETLGRCRKERRVSTVPWGEVYSE